MGSGTFVLQLSKEGLGQEHRVRHQLARLLGGGGRRHLGLLGRCRFQGVGLGHGSLSLKCPESCVNNDVGGEREEVWDKWSRRPFSVKAHGTGELRNSTSGQRQSRVHTHDPSQPPGQPGAGTAIRPTPLHARGPRGPRKVRVLPGATEPGGGGERGLLTPTQGTGPRHWLTQRGLLGVGAMLPTQGGFSFQGGVWSQT